MLFPFKYNEKDSPVDSDIELFLTKKCRNVVLLWSVEAMSAPPSFFQWTAGLVHMILTRITDFITGKIEVSEFRVEF